MPYRCQYLTYKVRLKQFKKYSKSSFCTFYVVIFGKDECLTLFLTIVKLSNRKVKVSQLYEHFKIYMAKILNKSKSRKVTLSIKFLVTFIYLTII